MEECGLGKSEMEPSFGKAVSLRLEWEKVRNGRKPQLIRKKTMEAEGFPGGQWWKPLSGLVCSVVVIKYRLDGLNPEIYFS